MPIRYTDAKNNNNSNSSSSSTNNFKLNSAIKTDIDIQRENKFKQIFEQNTVDLSMN